MRFAVATPGVRRYPRSHVCTSIFAIRTSDFECSARDKIGVRSRRLKACSTVAGGKSRRSGF